MSGEEEGADGDEEDDSQEESDEDAELAGTDAKRAAQASGSHPLQQSFKAAAGELLKKYGIATGDAGRPLRSSRDNCPLSKALSFAEDNTLCMPHRFKAAAGKLVRIQGLLQMTQVGLPALP